jgi:CARDB
MRSRISLVAIGALCFLCLWVPTASSSVRQADGLPNLTLIGWAFGVNCTQFGSVFAEVTNTGTVSSPRFLASVQLDGSFFGKLGWMSDVPPGDTVELGPTGWRSVQFEPGVTHTVTMTIDPRNVIEESSEVDNSSSTDFAC